MAEQQFLVNIDLMGNAIVNLVLNPLAAAPANANPYYVFTNTTDGLLYMNFGTFAAPVWKPINLSDEQKALIVANQTAIATINSKIPAEASDTNQLADKDYVADSISQSTAFFRGDYATKAALLAVQWQTDDPEAANYVTNNDYAVVLDDESNNDETWRYIYVSGTGWQAQYRINESPLTTAQLNALNSGITADGVAQIGANQTAIANLQTRVGGLIVAATGSIGTEATSTSVAYGGTLISAYATMNGSVVTLDISVGAASVTFSTAETPSAAIVCTVVYAAPAAS